MRKLIYDVAITLDRFIGHEDGSAGGFLAEGDHVTDYLGRLQRYDTVVMGRRTYEYGYAFGLAPGKRAYPHMRHLVFSKTLRLPGSDVEVIDGDPLPVIRALKDGTGTDIYLCGGGAFAGHLLDHGLIDELALKLNPLLFGRGIPLFGPSRTPQRLALTESRTYKSGVVLLRYTVEK